jgi:hypothetical protein
MEAHFPLLLFIFLSEISLGLDYVVDKIMSVHKERTGCASIGQKYSTEIRFACNLLLRFPRLSHLGTNHYLTSFSDKELIILIGFWIEPDDVNQALTEL